MNVSTQKSSFTMYNIYVVLVLIFIPFVAHAHDGPHDDYEPPEYRFEQQKNNALLSIKSIKNRFVITFKTSLENLLEVGAIGTPKESIFLEPLKSHDALMLFPKQSECAVTYAKLDRFQKHRSTRSDILSLDKKTRSAYIEPFIEVIASYKVVCNAVKSQKINVILNVLTNWNQIKQILVLSNSKLPEIPKDGRIFKKDTSLVF